MNAVGRLSAIACLALIVTCSVAGCGGGGGGGDDSSGSSGEVKGTVTVWDFEYESYPGYTKAIDQLNAEFEKEHPEVNIDWVAKPYESYEATYRAAFTAHQGPDIMSMQPGESGVLSFAPGLEVLNSRVSPELEQHLTQWQTVTPGLEREGDRYGLPIGLQGWTFYYNKKLFKKAGLPTDFEPQSWTEIREAGEKLKAAGIQPFTGGDKEGLENSFWFGVGFASANSEAQISELADGTMSYTDPPVEKAIAPLDEMVKAGLFSKNFFTTPWIPDGYAEFAEEKGAMALGFWEQVGYWGEFIPTIGEKNLGMFFPPGKNPVAPFGGFSLAMTKFAQNKDAAWALMEFYGSKHANEVLYDVGGLLPVRNDVPLPSNAPQQAVELVEASREPRAAVAPFAAMKSNIAFATLPAEMNEALQGRQSIQSALSSIQEANEKTPS